MVKDGEVLQNSRNWWMLKEVQTRVNRVKKTRWWKLNDMEQREVRKKSERGIKQTRGKASGGAEFDREGSGKG